MTTADQTQDISAQERVTAKQYLLSMYRAVDDSVKDLGANQLAFKPSPECWSIAETVEHMALIGNVVIGGVMSGIDKAPPPAPDMDRQKVDSHICAMVPKRTTKIKAPESVQPKGKLTVVESLGQLHASHLALIKVLETNHDLRGHSISHPAIGPLDGYQWILVTAAHADRHVDQINEIKADPHFPKA